MGLTADKALQKIRLANLKTSTIRNYSKGDTRKKDFQKLNRVPVNCRSTLNNIIVVPKKEQYGHKTVCQEIMAKNFPNSIKLVAHCCKKLNKPSPPHAP